MRNGDKRLLGGADWGGCVVERVKKRNKDKSVGAGKMAATTMDLDYVGIVCTTYLRPFSSPSHHGIRSHTIKQQYCSLVLIYINRVVS